MCVTLYSLGEIVGVAFFSGVAVVVVVAVVALVVAPAAAAIVVAPAAVTVVAEIPPAPC